MKSLYVLLGVAVGAAVVVGQTVSLPAHYSTVVASYSFKNQTTSIQPVILVTPDEAGIYRISEYAITDGKTGGLAGAMTSRVDFTNDFGVSDYEQFHDPGGLEDGALQFFFLAVPGHFQSSLVIHVGTKGPLIFSTQLSAGTASYNAYVTVEHL